MLSDIDREYLEAIRHGESASAFALRKNYSRDWAKWKSKQLRQRFGVQTIWEVVRMSQGAEVTRADLEAIERRLSEFGDAVKGLQDARTDGDRASAQREVRDARSELADELDRRGLTMRDLDAAAQRKFDEKVNAAVDAREKARADEEKEKRRRQQKRKQKAKEPPPPKPEVGIWDRLTGKEPEPDEEEDEDDDDAA